MSRPSPQRLREEITAFTAEQNQIHNLLTRERMTPGDRRHLDNLYWRLDRKIRRREAKLEILKE